MDHQAEVLKFGEEISALVEKHKDIIPLTAMAKVLATIQVDLMAIHAAIQVAAHLKPAEKSEPAPE